MNADNSTKQPTDCAVAEPCTGPVLISDNSHLVYDLGAQRKRHLNGEPAEGVSQSCSDGVCVLSWRPRKPRNDAA